MIDVSVIYTGLVLVLVLYGPSLGFSFSPVSASTPLGIMDNS